jgi:hypothetical protein
LPAAQDQQQQASSSSADRDDKTALVLALPRGDSKLTAAAAESTAVAGLGKPAAVAAVADMHSDDAYDDDELLCVVCLDGYREVGLVHKGDMHLCLCSGCAGLFGCGSECPMCRQTVEAVVPIG